jgi:hypothetical protein
VSTTRAWVATQAAEKFSVRTIIFKGTVWRVRGVLKIFGSITFAYVRPGSHTSGIRNKKKHGVTQLLVVFASYFRRHGSPITWY